MNLEEIKLLRLSGHHLLAQAEPLAAVRDLCGLQAQFLSNAVHGLHIRSGSTETAGMVKSWTIRGTVHVFAESDLPLMLHEDRSRFLRPCDTLEADECITKDRKRYFADLIVEQITAGVDSREELKAVCAAAGMTEREGESVFNAWGGTIRALCEAGVLCHKVQEKKAFMLCPSFEPMSREAAELELARRYFTHYGPATLKDAAYFFGTTQTRVKQWLARLPVTEAQLGGRTYYYIENGPVDAEMPACLFLAGFDPLMLGYEKQESLYLPKEHLRGIFNLAGIVMPAVLLHGRVVGKWKRKGCKLEVTLFEPDVDKRAIEEAARDLWPGAALQLV